MAAPEHDINQALGVRKVSENEFESIHPPSRIGAYVDRAFGGVTSAMCLNAAYQTVADGSHIYSLQGNFLGPALIDRALHIKVRRVRDTKTFATRMLEASQVQDNGERRVCLVATADFMVQEQITVVSYSEKPRRQWTPAEDGQSLKERTEQYVKEGRINKGLAAATLKSVYFTLDHYDMRYCDDSPFGATLFGGAKHITTSQDDLPVADKVSGDYVKSRAEVKTEPENAAALACLADMATGFIAAVHNRQGLSDFGITSSLEFSLRFFSNSLNMNEWHLREMSARVGSEGRSFHEIRLWDKNEHLVACMTQQAIMRAKPDKSSKI